MDHYAMDVGYEYSVKMRDRRIRRKRFLLFIGALLGFVSLYLVVANGVAYGALFYPMIFCLPLILVGIVWFFHRFLSSEIEYTLRDNTLTVTEIFGKSDRKIRLELPINTLTEVAPYDDGAVARIESFHPTKDYHLYASFDSPTLCYAIISDEDHISVLYFDMNDRMITLLRHKIPSAMGNSMRWKDILSSAKGVS